MWPEKLLRKITDQFSWPVKWVVRIIWAGWAIITWKIFNFFFYLKDGTLRTNNIRTYTDRLQLNRVAITVEIQNQFSHTLHTFINVFM